MGRALNWLALEPNRQHNAFSEMIPPGQNPEIDFKPILAADLVRMVWNKTRRRTLYRFVRDAANEIRYSLRLLLGDEAPDDLAAGGFFAGASAAAFRAWVYKCPSEVILLTEQARLKGVVDPVYSPRSPKPI